MTQVRFDLPSIKWYLVILSVAFTVQLRANTSHKILITEFLALNSSGFQDEDGDYSDWIELYNPGETAVDLTGWHLTDNDGNLEKWTFPAVLLGAGNYLVVIASGKDRAIPGSQLHTNFKLSGGGEYLAIVEADSAVISYEYAPTFPAQQTDKSYGIYLNQHTYFATPTPGAGNALGAQVLTPVFSVGRGFYSSPFTVTLSVADADASIYYTTDGTRPSATTGKLYTTPIQITTTTPLSAACISNGEVSAVVSNTYIFINDVINQPAAPAGYPTQWGTLQYGFGGLSAGTRIPADYEMDPDICTRADYQNLMDDALTAIPTVAIVTNPGYLFSYSVNPDTGGIYIYTGDVAYDDYNVKDGGGASTMGADWERPTSVEYYDPSDSSGFQIVCGLRLHGGNSKKCSNSPKHSFTLSFRSDYGFSKLNYDLYDDKKATEKFDDLVLRAGYNLSWFKIQSGYSTCTDAQYIIDPFAKRTLLDMNQPDTHGQFVHLYINGLYWGVYELAEKINKNFAETYSGGEDSEYDVFNDDINTSKWKNGWVDGDTASWNDIKEVYTNSDPYETVVSKQLVYFENFVDYMLMNYYIGNTDWDENNWFIYRNRVTPGEGFTFTCWDAETSLLNVDLNNVTLFKGLPTKLFNNLASNTEFKLLIADRIQKHFFNGGTLTEEATAARYEKLANKIDTALIGESARWGDYCKDVALTDVTTKVPYNLFDHWLPKKQAMLTSYFPYRTSIVYNQLKNAGFTSVIDAPVYNSLGGELTDPVDLTISATTGTIYYTLDGTDPRTSGTSAVSPLAEIYANPLHVVGAGTVKARAKNGSDWSALAEVTFLNDDTTNFVVGNPGIRVMDGDELRDVFAVGTTIHYTLPADGYIRLDVYRVDGRLVTTLEEGTMTAGHHSSVFDQTGNSGRLYLYKLNYNGQIVTGKLFLH